MRKPITCRWWLSFALLNLTTVSLVYAEEKAPNLKSNSPPLAAYVIPRSKSFLKYKDLKQILGKDFNVQIQGQHPNPVVKLTGELFEGCKDQIHISNDVDDDHGFLIFKATQRMLQIGTNRVGEFQHCMETLEEFCKDKEPTSSNGCAWIDLESLHGVVMDDLSLNDRNYEVVFATSDDDTSLAAIGDQYLIRSRRNLEIKRQEQVIACGLNSANLDDLARANNALARLKELQALDASEEKDKSRSLRRKERELIGKRVAELRKSILSAKSPQELSELKDELKDFTDMYPAETDNTVELWGALTQQTYLGRAPGNLDSMIGSQAKAEALIAEAQRLNRLDFQFQNGLLGERDKMDLLFMYESAPWGAKRYAQNPTSNPYYNVLETLKGEIRTDASRQLPGATSYLNDATKLEQYYLGLAQYQSTQQMRGTMEQYRPMIEAQRHNIPEFGRRNLPGLGPLPAAPTQPVPPILENNFMPGLLQNPAVNTGGALR